MAPSTVSTATATRTNCGEFSGENRGNRLKPSSEMDSAGSNYYLTQSAPRFKVSKPPLSGPTPLGILRCAYMHKSRYISLAGALSAGCLSLACAQSLCLSSLPSSPLIY